MPPRPPCNVNWYNSFLASAYVAAVDVNDGIRWLQQHAGDYHIDAEKVVVAGHSAGAFTALNVAFLDQNEIQQVISSAGLSGKYLGEPLDPVTGIRACISMSGASLNLDWIGQEEITDKNIAVGIIHGTSDGVVDYDAGLAIPCCQTYGATVYGGCEVAKRVSELGGNWYLLSGQGFGHDIGEQPWFDTLSVQLPAFVVKTVVCGENIAKHSAVARNTPLPMCPGNAPNLPVALPCDVDAITPGITTPVIEATGAQVEAALGLLVYPNPVHDVLQVRSNASESDGMWRVTIYHMDGRWVRRMELEPGVPATIDLGDVAPGMYCLFFQAGRSGRSGVVRVRKD
ncbi:MAG: alpha/beta hydrolase fold domain-containing protein [Lewinellaceae bacterium]|nr:alpha/beta hydrolase fold domain-containing protein [Lewinellaceae bacterium]